MVQLLIQFGKFLMNKWLCIIVFLLPSLNGVAQKIFINELSASVTNSQVDNYGEFEDWIEVYNGTGSDVNLAGWYLSDNPDKPLKWRIPEGFPKVTTVLAGSCLIFWADRDTLQGPDHLGFSLKRKGEHLFLFQPSKEGPVLVDSLSYGELPPDHSFGRCPERNFEWMEFKHPTPGKPNVCDPVKIRKGNKIPLPSPPEPDRIEPDFSGSSGSIGIVLSINEISCNNKVSLADGFGENDDWIELYNPGSVPVNIAGWYISDTLNTALFHRIPSYDLPNTLIPAGGYLLLWADAQAAQGVTHLPFKLDKDGEELYLARLISGKYERMDEVAFPKAKNDVTFGRIPDGTGSWQRLSDPTPLAGNLPPRVISGFVLNELMAVSGTGWPDESGEKEDWIEFFNPTVNPIDIGGLYLTDSLANPMQSHITTYAPDSTTIPPGGYLVFFADNQTWQGARHLSFKLAGKGGKIMLTQPDGVTKISETFYPYQGGDASFGRYPDGQANWLFTIPTPGTANQYEFNPVDGLFVNEFMADNLTTEPDGLGRIEDWIEIFNSNSYPVNVGSLFMTDSLADPLKFRIPNTSPDSTTIAAGGFLVFRADNHPELGVRHLDFKLAAEGESIGLVQLGKGVPEYLDSITYPAQSADIAYGRIGDAGSSWTWFTSPTPGASNGTQSVNTDMLESQEVSIFPIPCVNRLNIMILLDNSSDILIDIFSAGGGKVTRLTFLNRQIGWNALQINNMGDCLVPGSYFMLVTAGRQIASRKLLIIK